MTNEILECLEGGAGSCRNETAILDLCVECDALRAELAECRSERARYGDMMSAALGQCENERDAARREAAEYRTMIDRCRERNKELGAENERLRDLLAELTYTPGNPSQDTL